MPVRIRKICGAVVPRGWEIIPFWIRCAVQKISIVDAVRVFFDENESFGCGDELARAAKLMVVRIVTVVLTIHESPGISNHRVHGDAAAALAPTRGALNRAYRVIGRAAEYPRDAADVRSERGLCIEQHVRVIGIEFPIKNAIGPIVFLPLEQHRFDFGLAEIVGQPILVVVAVKRRREVQLFEMVQARNLVRAVAGLAERRKE